jgi:hypothetical protein
MDIYEKIFLTQFVLWVFWYWIDLRVTYGPPGEISSWWWLIQLFGIPCFIIRYIWGF